MDIHLLSELFIVILLVQISSNLSFIACYFTEKTKKINMAFRGPCIVIYFYNKIQQDALFLNFQPDLARRQST